MSQVEAISIPAEVSLLVGLTAERWGYYIGRKALNIEKRNATADERKLVADLNKQSGILFTDYYKNGTDVRADLQKIAVAIQEAKVPLEAKSKPYNDKIAPLSKAIGFIDNVAMPVAIEKATGEKVVPRFSVGDITLKAMVAHVTAQLKK